MVNIGKLKSVLYNRKILICGFLICGLCCILCAMHTLYIFLYNGVLMLTLYYTNDYNNAFPANV